MFDILLELIKLLFGGLNVQRCFYTFLNFHMGSIWPMWVVLNFFWPTMVSWVKKSPQPDPCTPLLFKYYVTILTKKVLRDYSILSTNGKNQTLNQNFMKYGVYRLEYDPTSQNPLSHSFYSVIYFTNKNMSHVHLFY